MNSWYVKLSGLWFPSLTKCRVELQLQGILVAFGGLLYRQVIVVLHDEAGRLPGFTLYLLDWLKPGSVIVPWLLLCYESHSPLSQLLWAKS